MRPEEVQMSKKHVAVFNNQTLRASELFPDYVCKRPEEALSDPRFMFEE